MAGDSQEERSYWVRWALACVVLLVAAYLGSYLVYRKSVVFGGVRVTVFGYSRGLPRWAGYSLCRLHGPVHGCESFAFGSRRIGVSIDGYNFVPAGGFADPFSP